jgi:transcriptional regulator with XRE-family HTH domain
VTWREAREAREALGYTQGALAKVLGTSISTVNRWEAPGATVPVDWVEKLNKVSPAPEGSPSPRGSYRDGARPARKVAPRREAPPPPRRERAEPEHHDVTEYGPGELGEVELVVLVAVIAWALKEAMRRRVVMAWNLKEVARQRVLREVEEDVEAAFARLHLNKAPPGPAWRCPTCLR